MKEKKKNKKLIMKVIKIALGAIILVSVALTLFGALEINDAYHTMFEEELKIASFQMEEEAQTVYDGDWSGTWEELYKGDQNINEEYTEIFDETKTMTGIEYTLFYGPTRAVTTLIDSKTGGRIVGTDAGDAVIEACLKGGKDFYASNLTINGAKYCAYYTPVRNSDGTVVGMMFAGRQSHDADQAVFEAVIMMMIIAVVIIVVIAALGIMVANKTSKKMSAVATQLENIAGGHLNVKADPTLRTRRDELGQIATGLDTLTERLGEVINTTKNMSGNLQDAGTELSRTSSEASKASTQVSAAVGDISRGAVSQAESVQTANTNTENIGDDIDEITNHVKELDKAAEDMKKSCDEAMASMEALIDQNNNVTNSVAEIRQTIESTNESAQAIDTFSQAITDIASQTNLLSLNASIEAARAGEAGQGFAVVADEIRKLADQSKESADQIKEIVTKLLADAQASVGVMHTLNENFEEQSNQLASTKTNMQDMLVSVDSVSTSSGVISQRVGRLEGEKDSLINIVTDLSAISEENAASSEETSASMDELTSSFARINSSAETLQKDAKELQDTISYFKD